ncbi:FHA domain-containing protein [Mycolicibacterium aurum]|uniref:FHA domain-containing protein n=1 Tax=Mycolicibacterium aurum TaxID=1791 RepID=A0A3S4RTB8_MYCAU|nr:MPT63 family protein [Mycolicibacterium aurum]VEG57984.1 FHA domain-containing protein [Mycolicibacterium aurum]
MKIKPALAATAAAAAVAMAGAPFASADVEVQWLGQPGELVNGNVVQHWTVSHLKPSTDTIPYQPVGTLWEATASDEAISGDVTPIVSNLNARAKNGDTYRVLFGVATPQGVNPSTLPQGEKTSGKIYFDVTGESPDSVFYSSGGPDELLWLEAPPAPAPATGSGGGSSSSGTATSPTTSGADDAATTDAPEATPAATTPTSVTPVPASMPEGSVGTPLPEGSVGTPLPEGSVGTPLPEGAAAAEAGPAPVPAAATPAAPAPAGSVGTPVEGATPEPAAAAPTTTVVPAPPA